MNEPVATSQAATLASGPAADFSVEPFSACAAEVAAFRNANRSLARDQRYFEWRYRRPCAHEPLIVWARNRDGTPLGAASVIPHDYFVLDGIYPMGLLGDISVLPACRGQGIAGRMLGFLARHDALRALRGCVVLPNDEAYGSLRRAGWRDVTAIMRCMKLLDTGPWLERKLGRGSAVRALAAAANTVLRAVSRERSLPRSYGYETHMVETFDARYDELWGEAAAPGRVLAVRNRSYLTWRFAEHPVVSYRTLEIVRAGKLEGYLVFHHDGSMAAIDDCLFTRAEVGVFLVGAFLRWLRDSGDTATVRVRANGGLIFALPWRRFGFIRRKDAQPVMLLDSRPAEGSALSAGGRWHVMAGDKDV